MNYNRTKLVPVNEIENEFYYSYQPFQYYRSVWDNYQQKKTGLTDGEGIIPVLAKTFPKNKKAKYYKPLGDFKDFINPEKVSRLEIYENWLRQFEELQYTENGVKTYKEISIETAYQLQTKVLKKKVYTEFEIAKGLSFMLWRCAEGFMLEIEVLIELQKRFNSPLRKIKAAPGYYEKFDIDAVMLNDKGEEIMYISIKNLGALSKDTLYKYRVQKGKTKPMIYMGFNKEKELNWLRPDEWDKRTLQEHLKSGEVVSIKD